MEDSRTIIEKLPRGYVNARRNAGLKFILTIYAYCIFNFLAKNNVFTISSTVNYIIGFSIAALCVYSLIYYMDIIKYFNRIEILNFRLIHTMKLWVKLLLWIPLLLLGYFTLIPFVILFCFLSAAYLFLTTGLMMD